jgi:hypothetical protein
MSQVKLTTFDYYDLAREKPFLEILKEYMDNDYPKFLSDLQTYYPGKKCVKITSSGVVIKVTWHLEVELMKYDEEDEDGIPQIIVRKLHNKTWTPIPVTYMDIMRAAAVRNAEIWSIIFYIIANILPFSFLQEFDEYTEEANATYEDTDHILSRI